MCLAIYKKQAAVLPIEHLQTAFDSNPDGAGFAASTGKKIEIRKGFFTFEHFLAEYKKFNVLPMLIHFRVATHGRIGTENCHPFALAEGKYAMIHNGCLPIESDKETSDTHNFAKFVLSPILGHVHPANPGLKYLIEQTIGRGNKVCVMDKAGKAVIYNELAGHWAECGQVWYSNESYKPSAWNWPDEPEWNITEGWNGRKSRYAQW